MYIRTLSVKNLKRLQDVQLNFVNKDGTPRMWTVLIGENGTGKTSILQSIALAAAGKLRVNELVGSSSSYLIGRRKTGTLSIQAHFDFTPLSRNQKFHPTWKGSKLHENIDTLTLTSNVTLAPKETTLRGEAWYGDERNRERESEDPLDKARALESKLWFVIGYGVQRTLPQAGATPPNLAKPTIDRLKSLFDVQHAITSTGFMSHFGSRSKKALRYSKALADIISGTEIFPEDIEKLELRGQGGVTTGKDLLERDRFHQKMGQTSVKVPALSLAHGYQSTVAWIADLIGHVLLEADMDDPLSPEEFEGLVLIDEIDLYLHPIWQARLIPALRKTFPKLQFVATTHSPVVLATLSPDEVIQLEIDKDTGNVVCKDSQHAEVLDAESEYEDTTLQADPRSMTGTEMYREFFGLDRLTLNAHGEDLRDYTALATNPYRTDYQDQEMKMLKTSLENSMIRDLPEPVARVHNDQA